ncbi:MAG: hypothetical protein JXA16_14070 [Bacteroidales bacterium]|nr:hypothetical protein [Bacteroidales bacterium]
MKKIAILSTILLFSMLSTVAFAQKDKKKEKKIEIKLQQKNEAGELIKIDTSFVLEEGQNAQEVIDKIMAEKGIKSEKKKNVWISIDDDSNKKE